MTIDMWIAILILFAAILLFLTVWVRVDSEYKNET